MDLLELAFSEDAASFSQAEEYEDSNTAIDWIRHHCRMGGGAAADRVCVGLMAGRVPQSVAALEEGRIGFPHLALIARTMDAVKNSARGIGEELLLEQAEKVSVGRFHHVCHHARHSADAEGYAVDQARMEEESNLCVNRAPEGPVHLKGCLGPVGGATLLTALEPLAKRGGKEDNRSREKRLADALVELALRTLDAGSLPQHGGQKPHLTVTASLETVRALPGAPAGELEFSLPISAKTVERLSCDCSLTRVLLSGESTVIDVGRAFRVVPGAMRKALWAEQKHCQWPGCDRAASSTSAHHLLHWCKGGGTDRDNLCLLCHRHHWMVHEGCWQLVKSDDGRFLAVPPLGDYRYWARGPTKAIS
jgi:hypothetical protein